MYTCSRSLCAPRISTSITDSISHGSSLNTHLLQCNRWIDRQPDNETDRQTDNRQTDRQTDRQREKVNTVDRWQVDSSVVCDVVRLSHVTY